MPSGNKRGAIAALLLALLAAGCAGGDHRPGSRAAYRPVTDLPVRIGRPYQVRGRTYVPADEPAYQAVGMASWYGSESGDRTANGERFRPDWISAAHRTLPLPSYVEVTALATGRVILVRVNDRGPFAADRILDLSRGAARLLGVERAGTIPVLVRRVYPAEAERAALRAGRPVERRTLSAAERSAIAGPRPVAVPVATVPPVTAGWFVQVATFADPARAAALARSLGGTVRPAGTLSRVRIGPLADGDAQPALARVRAAGYQDARLVRETDLDPIVTESVR
jgi:rare lipoprotein A